MIYIYMSQVVTHVRALSPNVRIETIWSSRSVEGKQWIRELG